MPLLEKLTWGYGSARPVQSATVRNPGALPAERICGAPGCTSGWMKPWKTRTRPVFEGEWGCGAKCLQTMVSAAVRREMDDPGDSGRDEPHRHRIPLGLVLLAQGWITHPQLQAALAEQRATGEGRIGEWLTRNTGLGEDRIARGLGVQWNCPLLTLDGFSPRAMALVMPKRFVAEFGLVPLRIAGSSILYVAFQERLQPAAAWALEQMCGFKVESGLLATTQMESARTRLLEADAVPVSAKLVADSDGLTSAIVKVLEQKQPGSSRLVRMHQYYWLRLWLEQDVSRGEAHLPAQAEDMEDHIFMVG